MASFTCFDVYICIKKEWIDERNLSKKLGLIKKKGIYDEREILTSDLKRLMDFGYVEERRLITNSAIPHTKREYKLWN